MIDLVRQPVTITIMSDKGDTVSRLDSAKDAQIHGVNNAALAVATLQQKPKLLGKSMLKVGLSFSFSAVFEVRVIMLMQ